MSKKRKSADQLEMTFDGNDLFVIHNGVKIAKRGRAGTRHAATWISLEPGISVRDSEDKNELIVEYSGAVLQ